MDRSRNDGGCFLGCGRPVNCENLISFQLDMQGIRSIFWCFCFRFCVHIYCDSCRLVFCFVDDSCPVDLIGSFVVDFLLIRRLIHSFCRGLGLNYSMLEIERWRRNLCWIPESLPRVSEMYKRYFLYVCVKCSLLCFASHIRWEIY